MADVGDIKPMIPVWPKRPNEKVGSLQRSNDSKKRKDPEKNKGKKDDDGKEHIDEFA